MRFSLLGFHISFIWAEIGFRHLYFAHPAFNLAPLFCVLFPFRLYTPCMLFPLLLLCIFVCLQTSLLFTSYLLHPIFTDPHSLCIFIVTFWTCFIFYLLHPYLNLSTPVFISYTSIIVNPALLPHLFHILLYTPFFLLYVASLF